jgi:drug/metabolite transporter (DMT)-like permease
MLWLIIAISAYFLFAIVALGDKYLLAGPPNPKSYSFYVGTLGILVLVLVPFVGFFIPSLSQIILSLLAGSIFIFALFGLYTGFEHFEASRVLPAIGGFLPLFTFGLTFFFSGGKEFLSPWEGLAFILLLAGSVIITLKKGKPIISKSFQISVVTAFLFAIAFVLTKFVYLAQPFWSGFIWMRVGGFLAAICFIFTKEVKEEIFKKKFTFQKKTGTIFLFNQALAAGAFILQNWAIALVPLGLLAFVNALEGTKYVFLLIFAIMLSLKFPKVLKEEISQKILSQKIIAILFIGAGLALLTL